MSYQLNDQGRWTLILPDADPVLDLLRRTGRMPALLEAWLEDQIISQVPEPTCSDHPAQASGVRSERLRLYKEATFGLLVEEHFSRTKHKRDRLIYSLLRSRSRGRVEELAIAIREGELDFAQAAIRWSEGPESASGGRIGPIAPGLSHPELNQRLEQASERELIGPFAVGDMHVLLRLDTRVTARLTDELRVQLVEELYREWMDASVATLLNGESIEPVEYLPPA